MDNFPSFNLSGNLNQSFATEGYPEQSSIKNLRSLSSKEKDQSSQNKYDSNSQQAAQRHEDFDKMNQNDPEIGEEVRRGQIGSKKTKSEMSESEDQIVYSKSDQIEAIKEQKELKPKLNNSSQGQSFSAIDRLFERLKLSDGVTSILYNDHANSQEEGKRLFSSLIDIFQSKCTISEDAKLEYVRDVVTFEYFDFNLQDCKLLDILGEGLHGLVIRMESKNMKNIVIKLFRDEKAFKDETVSLSNVQKARESSIHQISLLGNRSPEFNSRYFKANKYYGLILKAGLGSLLDFKNYLRDESKLSAEELFIWMWELLDNCYCLHKIEYCHRDIKPENIIINPDTFLPELIDYSLAADVSKVKGCAGTLKYRMEDFDGMEKYMEKEKSAQLVANDYFAMGKTILEIAFPDDKINTIKDIRRQLEKLRKVKSQKVMADILEICIFGSMKDRKSILEEHTKKYLNPGYWDKTDELKFKDLMDVYDAFNPMKGDRILGKLKEKHLHKFEMYMEKKNLAKKDSKASKSSNAKEFTAFLSSKNKARSENDEMILESLSEEKIIYDEEKCFEDEKKYMTENFEKNPEKALEKCFEVLGQLADKDFSISDPRLCSTLMTILYSHDFLDDAIDLGSKLKKFNWILLNNFAFTELKRSGEFDNFLLEYFKDVHEYGHLFIEELIQTFRSAACYWNIKQSSFTKERVDIHSPKEELVLTFFKMRLRHPESYFLMNHSYTLALIIDQKINEKTREKIKDFVYGVNISNREKVLDLINCPGIISMQLVLISFCEIFATIDCSEYIELEHWKAEAQNIIDRKKMLATQFDENQESLYLCLLESSVTYLMAGFIILYNLNYDLLTKFDEFEWIRTNESRQFDSDEELNKYINKRKAEQDKKWSSQKFLDKALAYISEITDGEFQVPLSLKRKNEDLFYSLSILGKDLSDILLFDPPMTGKNFLLQIDTENNLLLLREVRMNFRLSMPTEIKDFLADSTNIQKLTFIDDLTLEFSDYTTDSDSDLFNSIIEQLTFLRLKRLEIELKNDIFKVSNEDFKSLFCFISSQIQLNSVKIGLDLSAIGSEAIEYLAIALKNLKELQDLTLSLKNCTQVEKNSIVELLNEIKDLSRLEYVDLYFAACPLITSIEKPQDRHFKLDIAIDIVADNSQSNQASDDEDY